MHKVLIPALVFCIGYSAWAKTDCLTLLSTPSLPTKFTGSDLSGARAWRRGFVGGANPKGFAAFLGDQDVQESRLSPEQREDWIDRYVLQQWSLWKNVSEGQRNEALALELRKISPPARQNTISLDGDAQLSQLSLRNKRRLLERLKEIRPADDNEEIAAVGRAMADKLVFNYLQSRSGAKDAGVAEPLASQRELGRLGLTEPLDFYSTLLQTSASVPFEVIPTNREHGLYNLGAQVGADKTRLHERFAKDNGFVLPKIQNASDLMGLFRQWDPQALDDVMTSLRFYLPANISTLPQLFEYLTPNRVSSVFPDESVYRSLAPLRTRLNQFVMTEPDATEFLREAFVQFVLWRADGKMANIADIREQFEKPGGAQSLFMIGFRDFLGWSGITLRIPAVVPARDYQIVQSMATPALRPELRKQLPYDSRRLDHNSMP